MVGVAVNCSWREPPRALFTLLFPSHSLTLCILLRFLIPYPLFYNHLCLRLNSTSLYASPIKQLHVFLLITTYVVYFFVFYSKYTYISM